VGKGGGGEEKKKGELGCKISILVASYGVKMLEPSLQYGEALASY
jgi:hypothetical protein